MQYSELFSEIYQLRIKALLDISISDRALKQQAMSRIYERGKTVYDQDQSSFHADILTEIAREEIQGLVSIPTGMDPSMILEDMDEEEKKTTILYYQENRNTKEIAGELGVSEERAEQLLESVRTKTEEKLKQIYVGEGITAAGFLVGMLKAFPAPVPAEPVPLAAAVPGIPKAVPQAAAASGKATVSAASSSAVSEAASVSAGKAAESSAVYAASNAGPAAMGAKASAVTAGTAVKTAAGMSAAKVAATAAVTVAAVGGGGYAGYRYAESHKDPGPVPEVSVEPALEEQVNTPVPEEVVIEETEEPEPEAVWIKEPQFEFDTVEPLVNYCYDSCEYDVRGAIEEVTGYPQEWVEKEIPTEGGEKFYVYTSNAAEFSAGETGGVISYDGEVLIDGLSNKGPSYGWVDRNTVVEWQPFAGYVVMPPDGSWNNILVLDSDFTGLVDRTVGGVGAVSFYSVVYYKGQLYNYADYVDQNSTEHKKPYGDYYTEDGHGSLVMVYDDDWNELGYGYITNDHGPVMVPEGDVINGILANGFYAVSRNYDPNVYDHKRFDTCAWVKADTGELITDFIYEDTWFFEDGYCPVKKDGYWGFINEDGKEVTDFVFEDVSTLYHGRAFVKVNGKFGILDIAETIDRYGYISSEMIGEQTEEPEEGREPSEVSAGEYEEVLQEYRDCLDAKHNGSTYTDGFIYANSMLVEMYDDIQYALYDIDGNGIQELIVAGTTPDWDAYDIGGIYSVFDGNIITLENYTVYRHGINILSNGILKEYSSWGWAWTRYDYYRIDPGDGTLIKIDCFESDYEKYPDQPWLDGEVRLTEEEMQEVIGQYEAEEISPEYKPL